MVRNKLQNLHNKKPIHGDKNGTYTKNMTQREKEKQIERQDKDQNKPTAKDMYIYA